MVGILGLLTGWALLMPAFFVIWVSLGLPYFRWMNFFLGIASSVPMLAVATVAGLVMCALSVRSFARQGD
jgi:hypothetical protein